MIISTSSGLFGPFTDVIDHPDLLSCDGADLPKSVIGAYQLVSTTPPADFSAQKYSWNGSAFVRKPDTAEEIAAAISAKCAACDALAKSKRDAVVSNISPAEMASWPIKHSEALAYQSSPIDASAPNLAIEALARGVATSTLVARVLDKSSQLAALEAQIAGVNGKHNDAVAAMTTVDAITAYDNSIGWPV